MQPSASASVGNAGDYALAADALYRIARNTFFQGRVSQAWHFLSTAFPLFEAQEARPQRLQLLLLAGQVLTVDHLLRRESAEQLFTIIEQTQQLAEELQDRQGKADALCLLGEARYFTTIVSRMKNGVSPDSPEDRSVYADALALQQQALALREELHDMRGISESCFQIGVIYERWQDLEQAQAYYARARQVADGYGYLFEKTEPARHLAIHTLRAGKVEQALALALQAVALREAAGFKPYLPLDYLLVRDIYQMQGDEENARLYTQKASTLAAEIGVPGLIASGPSRRDLLASREEEK